MMKQRQVRLPGTHIRARLDPAAGTVLDLSMSGAMLALDKAVPVGTEATLILAHASHQVAFSIQVVRMIPAKKGSGASVGVKFLNLSTEQSQAIPRLLRPFG